MPRRHKSKRSVKEGREYYLDSDEDLSSSKGKRREGKESGGERRKPESRSVVVKESSGFGHGNGYSLKEYVLCWVEEEEEKDDKVGTDWWNGSGEVREGRLEFDDKVVKLNGVVDLKSKVSSGRHDGEVEENVDMFVGKRKNFPPIEEH